MRAVKIASIKFRNAIGQFRDDADRLAKDLKRFRDTTIEAILTIPTDVDSQILEAHSPFQAYCRIKAFCETTGQRLVWADPYMGPGLFHRYLNGLPEQVEVALVTKDRSSTTEYADFLDVSRLFAQERGSNKYRLVTEQGFHDRCLRCDDQLYHLGGSAKDAGRRSDFTITKMEPTAENFKQLDDLFNGGTELFGPTNPNHP